MPAIRHAESLRSINGHNPDIHGTCIISDQLIRYSRQMGDNLVEVENL